MKQELTLSIIKPDAVERNLTGKINSIFEGAGLKIVASKMIIMSKAVATKFYDEHKDKPFFGELVDYISSGPVLLQVLSGENAVARHREIMGATNPKDADSGTVRAMFGMSIDRNSVHGSDNADSASREIDIFFSPPEIYNIQRAG